MTKLVEDRFGKKGANVMSNLLGLGHTRIADLIEAYFPSETETDHDSDHDIVNGASLKRKRIHSVQPNGITNKPSSLANGTSSKLDDRNRGEPPLVNGHGNTHNPQKPAKANGATKDAALQNHEHIEDTDNDVMTSPDDLYITIRCLVQHGWLRMVTETQYLSPGDMHNMLHHEAIENKNGGNIPTSAKDKDIVLRATLEFKRQMRDDWLNIPNFSGDLKAAALDSSNSSKRVKINGVSKWLAPSKSVRDDSIVLRVNPEKVAVAMRTEQLVQLVEQRLGHTTAHIYQTMLRILEANMPRCYEEWPEPPLPNSEPALGPGIDPRLLVNARDIAQALSPDIDIVQGLEPNTIVKIARRGHVRSQNILSQPINPSRLSADDRIRFVDKHIQLLSNDPLHFVTWHSRGQWHVEFDKIAKHMIQTEVENTISARQGPLGVQLIRALQKKGKLDERAICNSMKMPANDIRGIVNDLTVQGFVQTQEIPKVDRREAKHSIHLVWYDRQRAREKLLHDTYRSISRILQRIAYEREKIQPLLSKAERSDVIGNEEKWLSQGELDALKVWKEVQDKLLLQLFREDDMVATLRDFHGPLISV